MKSEDKAEIMKTLEVLTKNITKLKDEVKAASPGRCLPKSIKTKTQVFWFVVLFILLKKKKKILLLTKKNLKHCVV